MDQSLTRWPGALPPEDAAETVVALLEANGQCDARTVERTGHPAAVEAATPSAKGRAGLTTPLAAAGIMPVRTIYLLRLGEETASLGEVALQAAEIHEEKTGFGVGRLVSLLLAMLSLNDLASG